MTHRSAHPAGCGAIYARSNAWRRLRRLLAAVSDEQRESTRCGLRLVGCRFGEAPQFGAKVPPIIRCESAAPNATDLGTRNVGQICRQARLSRIVRRRQILRTWLQYCVAVNFPARRWALEKWQHRGRNLILLWDWPGPGPPPAHCSNFVHTFLDIFDLLSEGSGSHVAALGMRSDAAVLLLGIAAVWGRRPAMPATVHFAPSPATVHFRRSHALPDAQLLAHRRLLIVGSSSPRFSRLLMYLRLDFF